MLEPHHAIFYNYKLEIDACGIILIHQKIKGLEVTKLKSASFWPGIHTKKAVTKNSDTFVKSRIFMHALIN